MEDTSNLISQEFLPLFRYVETYARTNGLSNVRSALEKVQDILDGKLGKLQNRSSNTAAYIAHFHHGLSVCRMLIDLGIPVERREEDRILAAAILHVLPEAFDPSNLQGEMLRSALDPEVYHIVMLLNRDDSVPDMLRTRYYTQIQENKAAVLIKLADQGHLAELLYAYSGWSARSYIHDIKVHFLPMCIYAKEHYPDVIAPISILTEKIRSLSAVAEILLGRFEEQEAELSQEILSLQEDNAMLRSMIKSVEKEDNAGCICRESQEE